MKAFISLIYCLYIVIGSMAQTLPSARSVNWKLSGLRDTASMGFVEFDMQASGVVGDGLTPNDSVLSSVLSAVSGPGAILIFPAGNFLFNNSIVLPSDVIIRGQGAENTTFSMDLGGSGHAFSIAGYQVNTDTSSLIQNAVKDSSILYVANPSLFIAGNWIRIVQQDSDLVTSAWAVHSVGQIVQIISIVNNKLLLASPLRMDFPLSRIASIVRIEAVKNVGIECFKINRIDNTAPLQSSNIYFGDAVNCWVSGIESQNCTFSHFEAECSSNLSVSKSYFHHAFEYGDGGRGYGVVLHFTTNECLVEDNVFEHLRHSMILQAGANGNVFAYNYSIDPYWTTFPNNSSGDMVLHGNYVYSNLFEQNIGQNIVIDNSHGPNGPYNTFFRNRAAGYGIFFSASNSPDQNFLGNEITNLGFPYSLVNYTILGNGHFIFGNNNKGTIDPAGTQNLPDSSYAYQFRPVFIPVSQWAAIGSPNTMGSAGIPAASRYVAGTIFSSSCGNTVVAIPEDLATEDKIKVYPNPVNDEFIIQIPNQRLRSTFKLYTIFGQRIMNESPGNNEQLTIKRKGLASGLYFYEVLQNNSVVQKGKIVFR